MELIFWSRYVIPWVSTLEVGLCIIQKCFVWKLSDMGDNINVQTVNGFNMNMAEATNTMYLYKVM